MQVNVNVYLYKLCSHFGYALNYLTKIDVIKFSYSTGCSTKYLLTRALEKYTIFFFRYKKKALRDSFDYLFDKKGLTNVPIMCTNDWSLTSLKQLPNFTQQKSVN